MPQNLLLFFWKMAKNLALSLSKWHKKNLIGENGGDRKVNPSANPDMYGNGLVDVQGGLGCFNGPHDRYANIKFANKFASRLK